MRWSAGGKFASNKRPSLPPRLDDALRRGSGRILAGFVGPRSLKIINRGNTRLDGRKPPHLVRTGRRI